MRLLLVIAASRLARAVLPTATNNSQRHPPPTTKQGTSRMVGCVGSPPSPHQGSPNFSRQLSTLCSADGRPKLCFSKALPGVVLSCIPSTVSILFSYQNRTSITGTCKMSILSLVLQGFSSIILIAISSLVWGYLKSPIRNIPGPFLAKFTNLWRFFDSYGGRPELTQRILHERYGSAVRLGPNVVSINDPTVIRTVYSTKGEFLKESQYP
jgi:hypothetical protein